MLIWYHSPDRQKWGEGGGGGGLEPPPPPPPQPSPTPLSIPVHVRLIDGATAAGCNKTVYCNQKVKCVHIMLNDCFYISIPVKHLPE